MTAKRAPIAPSEKPTKVRDDFVTEVNGTEVRLPSLSYLKPGVVRKIRRLGSIDAMYTLMELVLDEPTLEVIDEMDPDEYSDMLEGWKTHSGVSLGES